MKRPPQRGKKVTTHEAKTHLSRLLAEVQNGEAIVICRAGEPVARLEPYGAEQPAPRPAVGTKTSEPVQWDEATFVPLTDQELKDWGL